MTTTHRTTVEPVTAPEPGALDGWAITCTCGSRLTTSLSERVANAEAERHLSWHDGGGER